MRRQSAPYGWAFYSADFSLQAIGVNCYGTVTFQRDPIETKAWHKLSEIIQEFTPLYVTSRGVTIKEAINNAKEKIAKISLLLVNDRDRHEEICRENRRGNDG